MALMFVLRVWAIFTHPRTAKWIFSALWVLIGVASFPLVLVVRALIAFLIALGERPTARVELAYAQLASCRRLPRHPHFCWRLSRAEQGLIHGQVHTLLTGESTVEKRTALLLV